MLGIDTSRTQRTTVSEGSTQIAGRPRSLPFSAYMNCGDGYGPVAGVQEAKDKSASDAKADEQSRCKLDHRAERNGGSDKGAMAGKTRQEDTERFSERVPWLAAVLNEEHHLTSITTPTRSILHVADFERIISSIRTQKTAGLSSVVINLKNSVFEGLELRVSYKEGRGLTAEFVALNETVRSAVESRSSELLQMFADRGITLKSLDVSIGSENPGESGYPAEKETIEKTAGELAVGPLTSDIDQIAQAYTGTSYLT